MKLPWGPRLFVIFIFSIFYAAFVSLPIQLSQEFAGTDWLSIALFHSYLFVFYPLFGFVVLVAFYMPAVVFTHFYWTHVRFGPARFLIGFFVLAIASIAFSSILLLGQPRAVWELAQDIPASAANVSSTCEATGKGCAAGPFLSPMFAVRAASLERIGLKPFARDCNPDPLIEPPADAMSKRQCFLIGERTDAATCCKVQKTFAKKATANYINLQQVKAYNWDRVISVDMAQKSLTGYVHALTLPIKTFFILVIIAIAILLVAWHKSIKKFYEPCMPKIERGLIVGAVAMLFWPLMEYAYAQSGGVLFGNWRSGVNLKASVVVLPWAVLIAIYFLRSRGFGLFSQLGSVIGALFAALQYDQLTNLAVRYTGSGAGWLELGMMLLVAFAGLVIILWPRDEDSCATPEKLTADEKVTAPDLTTRAEGGEVKPAPLSDPPKPDHPPLGGAFR